MVRIVGVILPRNKAISVGLTSIFGIGTRTAQKILIDASVSPTVRCKDMEQEEIAKVRQIVRRQYVTEGDLRRSRLNNIKRLKDIGSSAGRRHRVNLPVRGQRTRTNARSRKSKKSIS
jgi:small subunit ribosomal protein S13